MTVTLRVIGLPAPQGSKTRMPNGAMVDGGSTATGRAKLVEWRRAVADAARAHLAEHPRPAFAEPLSLVVHFSFPPTKSAPYRFWHASAPDLSKLLRATEDALVHGGLLANDRYIVRAVIDKAYSEDEPPGAEIQVWSLADQEAANSADRKRRAGEARKRARAAS